jgi:hypothetical protein
MPHRIANVRRFVLALAALCSSVAAAAGAPIRDGGIDPANLGKGDWIYFMSAATNKLGGNVASVTNENSLMLYYKSQGIRYFIVKAATSDYLFNGGYASPQFTSNLVNIAHAHGLLIFGYNRSYGSNVAGEIAISDFVFNLGADGFVWDAEAEWETGAAQPWITNGPAQAWALCSAVRSNWPTKFLAHAPFPIISLHSSFPYKEFGYWSDTVMPQIYHFSSSGLRRSPSAMINWSDVNWNAWQNSLIGSSSVIGGATIYWTNAIKPLAPIQDVYGPRSTNVMVTPHPDEDVMEFIDYMAADPNTPTAGGYKGVNFWRTDLHGSTQWAHMKAATSGEFPGKVNNIVMDDANSTGAGAWTAVRTFNVTNQTAPGYIGATGTDTNSFGTNYWVKGQGNGSAYRQFTPNVITTGDYNLYEWHPYRTDASASVPFVINYNGGTTTVLANQQTNSGNWSSLGRFNFAAGTSGSIRIQDNFPEPGGVALADGIKLVFVASNNPAPVLITGVEVTTGARSALVRWQTTGACNSQVEFGLTTNLGTLTLLDPVLVTNHSVLLSGLGPNQNYYFTALSRTGTNTLRSAGWSFATAGELILDNTEATFTGTWSTGTSAPDKYGADYRFATVSTNGSTGSALFTPVVATRGNYDVFIWYPAGGNRTTNAQVTVYYLAGNVTTRVNQELGGGAWLQVGTNLAFAAGTGGFVRVSNSASDESQVVMADAVRFVYRADQDTPTTPAVPDWWAFHYFGANTNALADSDGDGYANWMEYLAGTDPTDAASRLGFALAPAGGALRASFVPLSGGRAYQVQQRLEPSGWLTLSNLPVNMGTNGQGWFTITNGGEAVRVLRLKVDWQQP